jgi:undecaprenyl diphosphate synthase
MLAEIKHIALIMDGNRRWARKRFIPDKIGHKAGADTILKIAKLGAEYQIPYITFYAFSTENWNRSEHEVNFLLESMRSYIEDNATAIYENNICVRIIGQRENLPQDLQNSIARLEAESAKYTPKITSLFAINYGGRDEIVRAVRKIIDQGGEVNADSISNNLDTKDIPDPDIIIRSGGRNRLSNFLTWQSIYSEIYTTETLWPDFGKNDFNKAIDFYKNTIRNYGA